MKNFIAIALLISLTGCGWINRGLGYWSGYTTVCVKETGVMYVQFPSGASVLVDKDGKPKACQP